MRVDKRVSAVAAMAALTCLSGYNSGAATVPPASQAQAMKASIQAQKAAANRTLNPMLGRMRDRAAAQAQSRQAAPRESTVSRTMNRLMQASNGYVTVDVIARTDPAALRAELESKGMVGIETFGKVISGRLPVAALADAAASLGVVNIRPAMARTSAGLTTSQGDVAMRADQARQVLKVSGKKVRVGVMSDSFNCLAGPVFPGSNYTTAGDDRKSKDLMKDIIVLKDNIDPATGACDVFSTDEGRAMMQIVTDVAPRADGAFYTAFGGTADFANGILRLASRARSDVIVDDVIYFAEPMFQDGIIAQAVDMVSQRGIPYFSSAGNDARHSWEGPFRNSGKTGPSGEGVENSFTARGKADTRQTMRLSDGAFELLSFQWSEPYISAGPVGSTSDLDIYFFDQDGNVLPDCDAPDEPLLCQYAGFAPNIGDDPIEIALVFNGTGASVDVQVGIELYDGPPPSLMKYVYYDLGGGEVENLEYATNSPTAYGHNNARGAEAVGAAAWYRTSQWGNPLGDADKCSPACLEYFSSAGGTPIYFDQNGRRLGRPEVRTKPGVTGPDRGNTTFFYADFSFSVLMEPDGFPNFAGTSASAPHVAAVAALMIEASEEWLGPQKTFGILRSTARDMSYRRNADGSYDRLGRGYDSDSGFGFVDAYQAVCTAAKFDERRTRCHQDD